ncbi:MAG: class I SAM-dependent methyltransferase [Anaerolineales bacterium]|nr:MAG: class I SAM-dependent methyltransferase [Anaerolineales bacterium]
MGSAEVQGQMWGLAAKDWAELQEPHHEPLWQVMLDEGNVGSGTRVLDAGCGGGGASLLAAKRGAVVSGLDAAAPLIEVAMHRVPEGDFRVGDIQDLPFDDRSFDAVILANSLQYSEDRIATLREMKRVCDVGGRVIVGLFSTPDKVEYRVVFDAVRGALPQPHAGKGPFELSEPGVLEDLFLQAEMSVAGSGEVECLHDYANLETFCRAVASGGQGQAVIQQVGEEKLREAVTDAAGSFLASDGSIQMTSWFRYVVATV